MKSYLAVIFSFCILSFSGYSQSIDWYELVIIPQIGEAKFLIVEVDSVGKRCRVGRENQYCTESEEAHDIKVADLKRKQLEALRSLSLGWKLVAEDSLETSENSDKEKYRYLIDYDFDLIGIDKGRSSVIYLKLDFLLIDRITGKIVGRSMQYDLKDPFEPMELLIDELIEINSFE